MLRLRLGLFWNHWSTIKFKNLKISTSPCADGGNEEVMVFLQSARPPANPFQADPTANLFVITHPKIAEHHPYSQCRLTIWPYGHSWCWCWSHYIFYSESLHWLVYLGSTSKIFLAIIMSRLIWVLYIHIQQGLTYVLARCCWFYVFGHVFPHTPWPLQALHCWPWLWPF